MDVYEYTRNDTLTIATSNTVVSLKTFARQEINYKNTSTAGEIISLTLGPQPAVALQGIVLNPGDAYSDSTTEGHNCYAGVVNAIASAGTATLAINER